MIFTKDDGNLFIIANYAKRIKLIKDLKTDGIFYRSGEKSAPKIYLSFKEIDASNCISDDERRSLYRLIIQYRWENGIYGAVSEWLEELDAKRASLKSSSFIDDL